MSIKKIIVQQKNSQKSIILTDESNGTIDDIKKNIMDIFSSDKIFTLQTKNDLLIGRSSELQSVLVSGIFEDELKSDSKENIKEENKYEKELKINND